MSLPVSEPLTWSVMVPVYNRTRYLTEALDSVVAQAPDPSTMQIEVVDNCSTESDVMSFIEGRYGNRVSLYRQSQHVSMAENWNTCIQRAKGSLIYILHDDDFVAPGYYTEIETLANRHPKIGLYATRNFFVDSNSILMSISDRILDLEEPSKVGPFLYRTPIQCAAVTVRRAAYETVGGFRRDMGYVVDCEMWARVANSLGAIVSPKVLAFYRIGDETDTHRLLRSAQGIRDTRRYYELNSKRYPEFSTEEARERLFWMAWNQYTRFKTLGDEAAAAANYRVWRELTPYWRQLTWQTWLFRKAVSRNLRRLFSSFAK